MVLWYRNSFLASVVSIFGCILIMGAIASFGDDPAMAVCFLVIGVALAIWGKIISSNKAFKTWWKQVENANLVPAIARDVNVAVQIYNKNPGKKTLQKIAALNPAAAAHIEQSLAAKQAK